MKHFLLPAIAFTICGAMSLQGAIVLTGIEQFQGGGFGNFDNFLTTSGGGQVTDRAGCTSLVGGALNTGDCAVDNVGNFAGGDEHPPGNPTNTNFNNVFAFGGNASSIRIVLNSAEQGRQDLSTLTLNELYLTLYDDAGTAVWSSAGIECGGVSGCVTSGNGITVTTQTGIGNYGLVFALDVDQAAALQGSGSGTLGLAASLSGAGGGLDTFLFSQQRVPGDPVIPEPGTWAMITGGLGMIFIARRRRS